MAEFQGIFCHPFPPSVLIIEGMGWMVGGAGWDGIGKGEKVAKATPRDTL